MFYRYVVCQLEFGGNKILVDLKDSAIYRAIINQLEILHGTYGLGCARTSPSLTGDNQHFKYLNIFSSQGLNYFMLAQGNTLKKSSFN